MEDLIPTKQVNIHLGKKFIVDYNSGLTMRSIAEKHNTHYHQVNKFLKVNNIKKRSASENNKLPDYRKSCKPHFLDDKPEICAELKSLYEADYSYLEIGEKFNVSNVTAKNWITRLGLEPRDKFSSHKSERAKERKKAIMQAKYGVDNPMQIHEVHEKAMKTGYRLKTVFIEGRQFSVMGYEPEAIQLLVDRDINVDEISFGISVPKIHYDYRNKSRVYFPDLYHEPSNTLYEVKSEYTFEINKHINKKKAQASKEAGFNHVTLIFNNQKQLVAEHTA